MKDNPGSKKSLLKPLLAVFFLIFLPLGLIFYFRTTGLIHGPVLFLYTHPLLWQLPIILGFAAYLLASIPHLIKRFHGAGEKEESAAKRDSWGSLQRAPRRNNAWLPLTRPSWDGPRLAWSVWIGITAALFGLITGAIIQSPLNSQAVYNYYSYAEQGDLPEISSARIMPYKVAEQIASSGFDSSTDRLARTHAVVGSDGQIRWTFGQVPNGFFRYWSKKSQGIVSQPADLTVRQLELTSAEFKYSPDTGLTDSIYWQLYRRDYLSTIPEVVFMLNDENDPVIVAPYLKYKGVWSKVPYLAGVYVVAADGQIEELSPEQAAETPFLARSGQIIPASLARYIQESYKYKNGIWNRFFTHEDQVELADTEDNAQPYLTAVSDGNPQWISTAEPYGKSYATKAILLTDSVTAKTLVWEPAEQASLSGNARALEVVRGLAIPGVLFNRFKAVEPRPIIHQGRLQFLISVVPNSFNTVTKSVIVDAASNKAVAIFNHDTEPGADQALRKYIAGEPIRAEAAEIEENEARPSEAPPQGGRSQRQLIEKLIKSNQRQAELLDQLQEDLQQSR